jgi:hypothetical protein
MPMTQAGLPLCRGDRARQWDFKHGGPQSQFDVVSKSLAANRKMLANSFCDSRPGTTCLSTLVVAPTSLAQASTGPSVSLKTWSSRIAIRSFMSRPRRALSTRLSDLMAFVQFLDGGAEHLGLRLQLTQLSAQLVNFILGMLPALLADLA